jgi:DNA-binding HxlR family transcriptional regulator
MKDKNAARYRSDCPVSAALEILGDRWTLLIVRDILIWNRHEYKAFLESGEGIATNVLADRLQKLEAHGVIRKVPHATDSRKCEYYLTEKGLDLAPVLFDMILWSAKYEETSASPTAVKRIRDDRQAFLKEVVAAARERGSGK